MTDVTERRSAHTDRPLIPSSDDDAEALFREARQRRRRRRAWFAGGMSLLLLVAIVGLEVSRRGPGAPPSTTTHRTGGAKTAAPSRINGREANSAGRYVPVQEMGLADSSVAWAANGVGLYLSTDAGRTWRNATPPLLVGQDVFTRLGDDMSAVGQSDLWLPVSDVIGLVPFGQSTNGSSRGEGIERSTNGGATWTFAPLPGCLQNCGGNLSLSFVSPGMGFAVTGPTNTGTSLLFGTDDGGATWLQVSSSLILGSGTAGSPQILFTGSLDGWALTGPSMGQGGHITSPGGVLYRTTDGGVSWELSPGLPSGSYELPTFFGSQEGVVLGNFEDKAGPYIAVFVTHDGGATWDAYRLPKMTGTRTNQLGLGSAFAAISPSSWKMDVGSSIYVTTNTGRTWARTRPTPNSATGTVTSVVFSSPLDGMALLEVPPGCPGSTVTAPSPGCYPTMTATFDGGRLWVPVKL